MVFPKGKSEGNGGGGGGGGGGEVKYGSRLLQLL